MLRFMRNLFLLLISASSVLAKNTYSQGIQEVFNVKSGTIESIFKQIKGQSSYEFFYNTAVVNVKEQVALTLKKGTLDEILKQTLGNKYDYSLKDNYVLVFQKKAQKSNNDVKKITIRGVVKDKDGEVLPGVSVVLKGSSVGVATDVKGEFSLTIADNGPVILQFSFIGMKVKDVLYTPQEKPIVVILEEDITQVEEVVVTGYQTINKTRMTGAVEVVTAKEIANKGYVSVGEVLRGTLAGVNTRNTSGKPGALPEIRIRGLNSLYGNMSPTWIVDGVPFTGDLNDLVPEDIESITVLKDAAATAIYGAEAANGVIVVQRKQGREEVPSIRVASTFSFEAAPKSKLDLMNSEEKIAFERSVYEDFPNQAVGGRVITLLKDADLGKITHEEAEAEIARLSKINTNWYDVIFRKPFSHNHNISFSGGTSKTQFYASLSAQQRKGLIPSNKYTSWNAMLRLSYQFNPRVYFSFNTSSAIRKDEDSNSGVAILNYATFANPYERPYDDEGNYEYDRSYNYQLSTLKVGYRSDFNILKELYSNTTTVNSLSSMTSLEIKIKILENLKFSTIGSISSSYSNTENVLDPGTYTAQSRVWVAQLFNELPQSLNNGSLEERNHRSRSYTWSNRLEYNQSFNDKHYVSLFLAHEMSEGGSNSNSVRFPEYDPVKGLTNVPEIGADKISYVQQMIKNLLGQSESRNRRVSFFMSGSYSYKDRYIFSASARMDGADIIGTKNRFSPLWNASLKYNLHNEKFMKERGISGIISELAFRFSYGYTGSIDKNALPFNVLSYSMSSKFFGVDIPSYIRPKNPSIKWQKKQDRSLGVDMGFFKSRIRATFNYYNNVTRDLLDSKSLPASVGIRVIRYNSSSIRNAGVEFTLNTVNVRTSDIVWSTSFNISHNWNKIIESYYKKVEDVPIGFSRTEPVEGTSTNSWIGYRFAGIDPLTGHTLAYVDNTNRTRKIGFEREDGTWVLDMDDQANTTDKRVIKTTLGNSYPPIFGGFGSSLSWRQWSLSSQFSFMTGHKITSAYYSVASGGSFSSASQNVLRKEMNRWRKPGDITDMPGYNTSGLSSSLQSDWYDRKLESGNYVKCTQISLGYYLKSQICKKLHLTSCRVNMNIRDIFTISKYKGLDPENFGAFTYPNSRKYMLSLSVGF